jgi:Flp pilus assembly protein TadB
MSATLAALGVVAGAWCVAAPHGSTRSARRRVASLAVVASRSRTGRADSPDSAVDGRRGRGARRDDLLRGVGAVGAGAAFVVVLDPPGRLVVGLLVALVAWLLLGRLEPVAARRSRASVEQELPFAADLLATCLAVGTPLAASLGVVGDAVGGALGDAFVRASAACALGAPVHEALAPWAEDPALAPLAPVARVVVRAATTGSALAASSARLADDLRSARRWRVDEVARRVGVRAAAPLGVCFLPAFVLLGIVPVVLAGARTLVL